jgi:hypothetical protein
VREQRHELSGGVFRGVRGNLDGLKQMNADAGLLLKRVLKLRPRFGRWNRRRTLSVGMTIRSGTGPLKDNANYFGLRLVRGLRC